MRRSNPTRDSARSGFEIAFVVYSSPGDMSPRFTAQKWFVGQAMEKGVKFSGDSLRSLRAAHKPEGYVVVPCRPPDPPNQIENWVSPKSLEAIG